MTIEAALFTRLSGYAGLTAEVSSRIYPVFLPQGCTLPAVCVLKISEENEHAMQVDAQPKTARFQVSSYAKTYSNVKTVNAEVRLALSRYRATVGDVVIHDIFFDGEFDAFESDTEIYHIPAEFVVYFT